MNDDKPVTTELDVSVPYSDDSIEKEFEPFSHNSKVIYASDGFNRKFYCNSIKANTKRQTFLSGVYVSIFVSFLIGFTTRAIIVVDAAMFIQIAFIISTAFAIGFHFAYSVFCERLQNIEKNTERLTNNKFYFEKLCMLTRKISIEQIEKKQLDKHRDLPLIRKFLKTNRCYLVLEWVFIAISAALLISNFVVINVC